MAGSGGPLPPRGSALCAAGRAGRPGGRQRRGLDGSGRRLAGRGPCRRRASQPPSQPMASPRVDGERRRAEQRQARWAGGGPRARHLHGADRPAPGPPPSPRLARAGRGSTSCRVSGRSSCGGGSSAGSSAIAAFEGVVRARLRPFTAGGRQLGMGGMSSTSSGASSGSARAEGRWGRCSPGRRAAKRAAFGRRLANARAISCRTL